MAQINIKWVNPAKEGKKFGSLVDVSGAKYMCPAALVSQFQPGTTVDVPVQSAKWGADVVEVIQGHAQATATSTSAWSKPQAPEPARSVPANYSTPASGNMDRKDALIFVTGTVGRAMGSGKFAAGDLMDLTHESLKAWFMLKDQLK
jgi:hypothetical protein